MAKLKMILSMIIFGTIGLFVAFIPLSSPVIAIVRAGLGTLFMGAVLLFRRGKINLGAVRKNALLLAISGAAIGVNWILLFEAYRHVSVAVATLCYYMSPVFVTLLAPLVLKEKLTARNIFACTAAAAGAALISGGGSGSDITGVILALSAAALYCAVVLMNKFIKALPAEETTFFQLAAAFIVLLPYVLLTEDFTSLTLTVPALILLAATGVIHTGFAYLLYFSALQKLPAKTAAVLSYIDPLTAVLLSVFALGQPFALPQACGAALIICGAGINELKGKTKIKYAIRKVKPEEVPQALKLVSEVFTEFEAPDYPPEGVETFRREITESRLFAENCESGACPMYVALDGKSIVGVMALRSSKTHITLNFVKKEYHRRGIATAIFKRLLADRLAEDPDLTEITVNSSPYGEKFYISAGFIPTAEEQLTDGIRYIPMKYSTKNGGNAK